MGKLKQHSLNGSLFCLAHCFLLRMAGFLYLAGKAGRVWLKVKKV